MIVGYRWTRSIGCSRREAARLTITALRLAWYDPPTLVHGRVVRRQTNAYGLPIPE